MLSKTDTTKPDATKQEAGKQDQTPDKREVVVIKKYANRRLYNTETSTYVTLEDLAVMVRSDRDFLVYDAKSGDDLTHSVLTQIIVEQEGRAGGNSMLPVPFLRQLIRFYDDAIGKMVPSYLQFSLENLAHEQGRMREQFAHLFQGNPFGVAAFDAMQQQTRKNMAMFEQAMAMWPPFAATMAAREAGLGDAGAAASAASGQAEPQSPAGKPAAAGTSKTAAAANDSSSKELAELRAEFAKMQAKIEKLSHDRE